MTNGNKSFGSSKSNMSLANAYGYGNSQQPKEPIIQPDIKIEIKFMQLENIFDNEKIKNISDELLPCKNTFISSQFPTMVTNPIMFPSLLEDFKMNVYAQLESAYKKEKDKYVTQQIFDNYYLYFILSNVGVSYLLFAWELSEKFVEEEINKLFLGEK